MKKSSNMRRPLFNLLFILLGNTIYALGVTLFILPAGLITGGTTGLALFFFHLFGVPISLFVAIFNLVMFLLGFIILGKKFAMTTLISTLFYPVILGIFKTVLDAVPLTKDPILCSVFGGIFIGVAIGMVMRAGASTGGMDIPPLILHKKFGLSISVTMYLFDFLILLLQMFFSEKEQILYGILLVMVYTFVLNRVLITGSSRIQVKIVSQQYHRINECIIKRLDRGSTLLTAHTGYEKNPLQVILSVISNRQLPQLTSLVYEIDPEAFMIVSEVKEVRGRGFSAEKVYR